jgi:hypothetical protein
MASLVSPKVVTGSDRDACQPMIEWNRFRKLTQIDIGSHEDIMDNFRDSIRRHSSPDDMNHMALVKGDQIGIALDLALPDAAEKLAFVLSRFDHRQRVVGHRPMPSGQCLHVDGKRNVAHHTTALRSRVQLLFFFCSLVAALVEKVTGISG